MAGSQPLIDPLTIDPADFPPLPLDPGFLQLASDELGNAATPADGFDSVLTEVIGIVDTLAGVLDALGAELLFAFAEADLIDPAPVDVTVAGFAASLDVTSTAVDDFGTLLAGGTTPTPPAGGGGGGGGGSTGPCAPGPLDPPNAFPGYPQAILNSLPTMTVGCPAYKTQKDVSAWRPPNSRIGLLEEVTTQLGVIGLAYQTDGVTLFITVVPTTAGTFDQLFLATWYSDLVTNQVTGRTYFGFHVLVNPVSPPGRTFPRPSPPAPPIGVRVS
jgi:hypothetical protein